MIVIDMGGDPAAITNQEYAIMQTFRMSIDQKGIAAFNPERDVFGDEQIKYSVNAVRRDAPPLGERDNVGNIISAGWLWQAGENIEHRRPHLRPLFTRRKHRAACGIG